MMNEKNLNEDLGYRRHPAIANSDLKHLHSPRTFYAYKQGLLEKQDKKEHQTVGILFEKFLKSNLEDFTKEYIVEPDCEIPSNAKQREAVLAMGQGINYEKAYAAYYAKPNADKAKELYDKYKEYIDFLKKSNGKETISRDLFNSLVSMKNSIITDPIYTNMFYSKGVEVLSSLQIGIDFPVERWGIQWKGELDWLVLDHIRKVAYVVDLKTTSKYISFFHYETKRYKYYRQMALYRILTEEYLKSIGKEDWQIYTRFVVVETIGMYEAAVIPIPHNVLIIGEQELEEAADIIKWHEENGWEKRRSQIMNEGLLILDWTSLGMYEEPVEEDENDS